MKIGNGELVLGFWHGGRAWSYRDLRYPGVQAVLRELAAGEAYEGRLHVSLERTTGMDAPPIHRGKWIKGDLWLEGVALAMEMLETHYGRRT